MYLKVILSVLSPWNYFLQVSSATSALPVAIILMTLSGSFIPQINMEFYYRSLELHQHLLHSSLEPCIKCWARHKSWLIYSLLYQSTYTQPSNPLQSKNNILTRIKVSLQHIKATDCQSYQQTASLTNRLLILPWSDSNSGMPSWWGWSFLSTISTENMIPVIPQQAEWYSLPNGCGLHGQKTHPGNVQWLVQADILSFKQIIQEEDTVIMFWFHSRTIWWIS